MQNCLPVFFKAIDAVCIDWNKNRSKDWGFEIDAKRSTIKAAHFFVEDLLKDNPAFPKDPGPFKVAAAFLVAGMHFIKFNFYPLQGGSPIEDEEEKRAWTSRFIFKALSVFLLQLKLTAT